MQVTDTDSVAEFSEHQTLLDRVSEAQMQYHMNKMTDLEYHVFLKKIMSELINVGDVLAFQIDHDDALHEAHSAIRDSMYLLIDDMETKTGRDQQNTCVGSQRRGAMGVGSAFRK